MLNPPSDLSISLFISGGSHQTSTQPLWRWIYIRKTVNLLFLLEQAGKAGISMQKHWKHLVVKQGLFCKAFQPQFYTKCFFCLIKQKKSTQNNAVTSASNCILYNANRRYVQQPIPQSESMPIHIFTPIPFWITWPSPYPLLPSRMFLWVSCTRTVLGVQY